MSITTCPRCSEAVTLPFEGDEHSQVQCPLCQQQFALGEALKQLPPMLILLEEESTHAVDEDGEYEAGDTEEGDYKLAASPFAFDEEPAPRPSGVSIADSARRNSTGKNPAIEIAKVVAGGALAIPIAQMILWWLPGKWQRDPLDMGPVVAKVIPFVVPVNLRNDDKKSDQADAVDLVPGPEANKQRARTQSDVQRKTQPVRTQQNTGRKNNNDEVQLRPALPKPATNRLSLAHTAALQQSARWDIRGNTDNETTRQDIQKLYTSFANLASVLSEVDRSDEALRPQLEAVELFLQSIATQREKAKIIAVQGDRAVTDPSASSGIALLGSIETVKQNEAYTETIIRLDSPLKRRVAILSDTTAVATSGRIFVLGTLLESPALNGYRGNAKLVVQSLVAVNIGSGTPTASPDNGPAIGGSSSSEVKVPAPSKQQSQQGPPVKQPKTAVPVPDKKQGTETKRKEPVKDKSEAAKKEPAKKPDAKKAEPAINDSGKAKKSNETKKADEKAKSESPTATKK